MISNAPKNGTARGIRIAACAAALAAAFAVSQPQPAHAQQVTVPPVPFGLEAPEGNKAFLVGHAVGTQNYICLPSGAGVSFQLFTPEATLFNDDDGQIITHFFSENPDEAGRPIRASWESSRDTSMIWAALFPQEGLNGSASVSDDAIAWLLLKVVGHRDGPTGGDKLSETTFVQRLSTSGGRPPSTGCSSTADIGNKAFVPYTADYFFYRKVDRDR